MRGSQQSGGCANNLEEDAAVMPSGTGLEVRIDGLCEQEARRMQWEEGGGSGACETGGGGGGDERGAEEEQAGRVAFARRAWRRRGEPSAPAAAIGSWQAGAGEEAEEGGEQRRETRPSARPSARRSACCACFLSETTD